MTNPDPVGALRETIAELDRDAAGDSDSYSFLVANGLRFVLTALEERDARVREGLEAVRDLIESSAGVDGLHLNGDLAPWDELRTGGRYEEHLMAFDSALTALSPEGEN